MDEQVQALGGRRRRRSRAEAGRLLAEFEACGLTREEFCRLHRVSLATLARYRKLARPAEAGSLAADRWVAVEMASAGLGCAAAAASGLAIALTAGRRIEVGRGFDAQTLVQWLAVLERS